MQWKLTKDLDIESDLATCTDMQWKQGFHVIAYLATNTGLLVNPAESASLDHELSFCLESNISCHACASNAGLNH